MFCSSGKRLLSNITEFKDTELEPPGSMLNDPLLEGVIPHPRQVRRGLTRLTNGSYLSTQLEQKT